MLDILCAALIVLWYIFFYITHYYTHSLSLHQGKRLDWTHVLAQAVGVDEL